MKPRRRRPKPPSLKIVLPVLIAAAMFGILVSRREEDIPAPKLPEDLTGLAEKARRAELVGALRAARDHGLDASDYLEGFDAAVDSVFQDAALSEGLLRYANHRRFGRANPGVYEKPVPISADALAEITRDGVEAGLQKLDPPYEGYRNLAQALHRARQLAAGSAPPDVRRIEEAMERWRWLPREIPNGAILVNIPEFRLQAVDAMGRVDLDMPVVVGAVGHPTPVFAGNLRYVVFSPYWNVPQSILGAEILPEIRRDPTYVTRNAYEVVDGKGHVVASGRLSDEILTGLVSGELSLRQRPGPSNALGRVKFMFPNQNHVYLHDTPNHASFAIERRALSHGCVRVSDPQALAEWVLRHETDWSAGRISTQLDTAKQTQANLTQPIPVFMLYNTLTAEAGGELLSWPDVYRRNR